MLKICFLLCLYLASTFACNGCSFNAKKFEVKSCAENSEKHFILKCKTLELTEDCQVKLNCTRDFPDKITEMMMEVSGTHNDMPFSTKTENACEGDHSFYEDHPTTQLLKMYGLDRCPYNPVNEGYFSKSVQLSNDQRSEVRMGEGISYAKIELKNINGVKGAYACYEIKTQMDCPKIKRTG